MWRPLSSWYCHVIALVAVAKALGKPFWNLKHIKKFSTTSDCSILVCYHDIKCCVSRCEQAWLGVIDTSVLGSLHRVNYINNGDFQCYKFRRNRQKGPRIWGYKSYSMWNSTYLPTQCCAVNFHTSFWTRDMNTEVWDPPTFPIYANIKYICKIGK